MSDSLKGKGCGGEADDLPLNFLEAVTAGGVWNIGGQSLCLHLSFKNSNQKLDHRNPNI